MLATTDKFQLLVTFADWIMHFSHLAFNKCYFYFMMSSFLYIYLNKYFVRTANESYVNQPLKLLLIPYTK